MLPSDIQNSPQSCWWEGFLLFGNFSSFMTPSPGQVSVPNSFVSLSFIFCPAFFWTEWAAFLGPPPAFRNCFVEVGQHSDDLLMNLWGRKWSPHPIPWPSWNCPSHFLSSIHHLLKNLAWLDLNKVFSKCHRVLFSFIIGSWRRGLFLLRSVIVPWWYSAGEGTLFLWMTFYFEFYFIFPVNTVIALFVMVLY